MMQEITTIDIYSELESIRYLLTRLVEYSAPISPSYHFPLEMYVGFDWSLINANPLAKDGNGYPQSVMWSGYVWHRKNEINPNKIMYTRLDVVVLVTFSGVLSVAPMLFEPPGHRGRVRRGIDAVISDVSVGASDTAVDKAMSAMDEVGFDTAVSGIFDTLKGRVDSAGSTRLAISMNMKYASELNKAYLAGITSYIEKRGSLSSLPNLQAHQEAKIAGHRKFNRVREQIVGGE